MRKKFVFATAELLLLALGWNAVSHFFLAPGLEFSPHHI
jgi:hypothetical protein